MIIGKDLKSKEPDAYKYVMDFAAQNKLKIREDRREKPRQTEQSDQRGSDWDYNYFKK